MINSTFRDAFASEIKALNEFLVCNGVDKVTIDNIVQSGYFLLQDKVVDSFYGNYAPFSLISNKLFFSIIKGEFDVKQLNMKEPLIKVKSLKEAINYLERFPAYKTGMLTFRGQTKREFTRRPYPNPFMTQVPGDGKEEIILPGAWRNNTGIERSNNPINPHFDSVYASELIFKGINVQDLFKRNYAKYGIHTNSDLEDFDDEESKEYYRRWKDIIVSPYYKSTIAALEQHYGLQTIGLDVTFDLSVALFFATHQFIIKDDGKATYILKDNFRDSIVYCFRFSCPPVTKTHWLIDEIGVFSHIPPIRPFKQICALPFFHCNEINAAAANVLVKIQLDQDFDLDGIPQPTDLFPDANTDLFYNELLLMKKKYPDIFGNIAEYEF